MFFELKKMLQTTSHAYHERAELEDELELLRPRLTPIQLPNIEIHRYVSNQADTATPRPCSQPGPMETLDNPAQPPYHNISTT